MKKRDELTCPTSCLNKAGMDEMVFVLRSKDAAAPFVIRAWVQERIRLGKNRATDAKITEALHCAETMEAERASKEIGWKP